MDNLLPAYQHPTLTVLIDDNQSFLSSLALQLNPQMACKSFHDPLAAIDWLHNAHQLSAQNKREFIGTSFDEESDSLGKCTASIDSDKIVQTVLNQQRFGIPVVLVIDYAMPQMNGVEFCQAIQSLPCKKILLTGIADEKVAVTAFNRKLIDRFIKKNDPDAFNKLEAKIIKLKKDFFSEQSDTVTNLLSRHCYAFLSEPGISALIEQLCHRYGFVEYYLFPNPSGILFFDSQGQSTLMAIETQAGLISHFEIARDHGAPLELLTALREFRFVPFFSDTGGIYQDALSHNWASYCSPSQICRGQQNYYWSLFDLPPHYLPNTMYSYANFLRDHAYELTKIT